ncbi:MAG TPA: hypothetical protein DEP48_07130 [Persephonella sp.]|uniref:MotA/TolQ/ExbB proton channel family protein n=1 Tax=Persephonella TaxID=182899 RepID=UPI00059FD2D4|nr:MULTISPECIES: MotA/TolQ/ExbB proton channel family protein [Persephonella]HCB70116.1 hypothetical protein [Persephonella sp.]
MKRSQSISLKTFKYSYLFSLLILIVGFMMFRENIILTTKWLLNKGGIITIFIIIISVLSLGSLIWDIIDKGKPSEKVLFVLSFLEVHATTLGLLGSIIALAFKSPSIFENDRINNAALMNVLSEAWLSTIAGLVVTLIVSLILSYEKSKGGD